MVVYCLWCDASVPSEILLPRPIPNCGLQNVMPGEGVYGGNNTIAAFKYLVTLGTVSERYDCE